MARLPQPGADQNEWGTILNEYLAVEHNTDGTLKSSGTLATKANNSAVVHLTGSETVAGIKTFSSSPIVPTPTNATDTANKAYVDAMPSVTLPMVTVGTTGSGADYECDGTADNIEIQAAITAIATTGGIVSVLAGTYNIAATITITGTNSYNTPTVQLIGAGMHASKLNMASGVHGIHLTNNAQVTISDFQFTVLGAGSAITASQSGSLLQSFWNSQFRNLYIVASGAHTTYAMNIGSPFRSVFENIEILNTHHGIRFYSEHADQNPGDCTVTRVFIECNGSTGSIGLHLEGVTGFGILNQMVFNMVEMIDNGSGGTGILLNGGSGVNHMVFIGINNEQFATAIDIVKGSSNAFDCNFVEVTAGGTFFKTGTDASGNNFTRGGMVYVGAKTNTVINDANTWNENPNRFENFYLAIDGGGAANATVVTGSTQIVAMRGYNSGTLSPLLTFGRDDAPEILLNKRIRLKDRTNANTYEIFVDNGVLSVEIV
jgi:hypothetical protein